MILAATEAAPDSATVLAGLDAPAGPADSTFVANLIERARRRGPGPLLVLDDVHEVRAREVLDGIQHLVEWADGRVRVALGCRFEPPIGLHRLRLTGRLHEVRAAQLAFTAEEADDFWSRHDIVLDSDSRAVLHTLIEGWPAGMRMAALSLEHGDPATFVAEFSGADRPVADYLAGEVLVRLPDDVVDFLLRTCVVEDLSVDLAARLSGRDDSAAMLDDLAQRNALVVPLDRSGTWFRYHALLRTYLAAALRRRDPGEMAALRRGRGAVVPRAARARRGPRARLGGRRRRARRADPARPRPGPGPGRRRAVGAAGDRPAAALAGATPPPCWCTGRCSRSTRVTSVPPTRPWPCWPRFPTTAATGG